MPPRQISTGQGRLAFGEAPGNVAADAAGATVDEDDEADDTVLVAEQQKQQKERTQPVLFTEDDMYTYSLSLSFSLSPYFSLTHSLSRVLSFFSSVSFSQISLN